MEYQRIVMVDGNWTTLSGCEGCGAAVADQAKHDAFHEALSRTASQANSADMWTRPIGGGASIPPQHRTAYQALIERSEETGD